MDETIVTNFMFSDSFQRSICSFWDPGVSMNKEELVMMEKEMEEKEEKETWRLLSMISIEPVVVLINLGRCMIGVQIANLYIEKTCKVNMSKL